MNIRKSAGAIGLFFSLTLAVPALARDKPEWADAHPPFHIAGNLYYVGGPDLGSYLVVTPQGSILINSSGGNSVPTIRKSVEQLGFKFSDIKVLLISHSHIDHAGGASEVLKQTHATYEVMAQDVDVIESGGKTDPNYGDSPEEYYPPVHVNRVLHDGDTVKLGGIVLTAHLTPGHTKGDTTWTLDEKENGKLLHVVIIGSVMGNRGQKLINNPKYPQIADDFEKSFAVLKSLPCDIYLGAHGYYFGMADKYKKWEAGDKNAFVDPEGYKAYVVDRQQSFEKSLQTQKDAAAQEAAK
jgi:metallo-beta-lactamase class B